MRGMLHADAGQVDMQHAGAEHANAEQVILPVQFSPLLLKDTHVELLFRHHGAGLANSPRLQPFFRKARTDGRTHGRTDARTDARQATPRHATASHATPHCATPRHGKVTYRTSHIFRLPITHSLLPTTKDQLYSYLPPTYYSLQGDPSDKCYVLLDGTVKVVIDNVEVQLVSSK